MPEQHLSIAHKVWNVRQNQLWWRCDVDLQQPSMEIQEWVVTEMTLEGATFTMVRSMAKGGDPVEDRTLFVPLGARPEAQGLYNQKRLAVDPAIRQLSSAISSLNGLRNAVLKIRQTKADTRIPVASIRPSTPECSFCGSPETSIVTANIKWDAIKDSNGMIQGWHCQACGNVDINCGGKQNG